MEAEITQSNIRLFDQGVYSPNELISEFGFKWHRDMLIKQLDNGYQIILKRYSGIWSYRYKNIVCKKFAEGLWVSYEALKHIEKVLNIKIL